MMNEQELKARILELERAIVESRRCFRESDPLEARAWLIRVEVDDCLLYTSPSPRDLSTSRMPSSA